MKEEAPEFEQGDYIKVSKFGGLFSTQVTPSVILHMYAQNAKMKMFHIQVVTRRRNGTG